MYQHPLAGADSLEEMKAHPFPDPLDDGRFAPLRAQAEAGVRDQVKVIIGGDRVTQAFADQVGADGYAEGAGGASRMAKALLEAR
jgi:hypothetical protein